MRVARAALAVEVVLCHMSCFVSREARGAAAHLSRFTVWRFEALSGRNPCVWAFVVRKPVRGASGPRIGGAAGWVALAGCVRRRGGLHRGRPRVAREVLTICSRARIVECNCR